MPSTKYCGNLKYKKNQNGEILFISSIKTDYFRHFGSQPSDMERYIKSHKIFINSLNDKLRKKLVFRGDINNNDIAKNWIENNPMGLIDDRTSRSFRTALSNCTIVVCDYLSTAFSEALVHNKPSVFFWNPNDFENQVNDNALKYFQLLKDVDILHDSPIDAADLLIEIYENIDEWWFNTKRQNAIKEFCFNTSRVSKTDLNDDFTSYNLSELTNSSLLISFI